MTLTRRSIIAAGGLIGSGLAASGVTRAELLSPQSRTVAAPPFHKLKIIVAGGHPGDPEYGCGGTIAALSEQGHDIVLLYLNDGAWPPTPAQTRLAEAKKACEVLKARRLYADQQNGHAIVDDSHYEKFTAIIDAEVPDAVFTHWMIDNHRDHRAITTMCYDAWQRSKKFALYYYEVSDGEDTLQFSPNRYVDISKSERRKKEACYAHASQTPERYYSLQDKVATFRGFESGYTRAEAFLFQEQSPYDILGSAAPQLGL